MTGLLTFACPFLQRIQPPVTRDAIDLDGTLGPFGDAVDNDVMRTDGRGVNAQEVPGWGWVGHLWIDDTIPGELADRIVRYPSGNPGRTWSYAAEAAVVSVVLQRPCRGHWPVRFIPYGASKNGKPASFSHRVNDKGKEITATPTPSDGWTSDFTKKTSRPLLDGAAYDAGPDRDAVIDAHDLFIGRRASMRFHAPGTWEQHWTGNGYVCRRATGAPRADAPTYVRPARPERQFARVPEGFKSKKRINRWPGVLVQIDDEIRQRYRSPLRTLLDDLRDEAKRQKVRGVERIDEVVQRAAAFLLEDGVVLADAVQLAKTELHSEQRGDRRHRHIERQAATYQSKHASMVCVRPGAEAEINVRDLSRALYRQRTEERFPGHAVTTLEWSVVVALGREHDRRLGDVGAFVRWAVESDDPAAESTEALTELALALGYWPATDCDSADDAYSETAALMKDKLWRRRRDVRRDRAA